MTNEDFEELLDQRLASTKQVLGSKGQEYGRGDRLHNFKAAGRKRNITPEQALMGMKLKHDVSVDDIVDDIDRGILPSESLLNEKIGDSLNYLVLLEALIKERIALVKERIR
jgi:hypothetical protein